MKKIFIFVIAALMLAMCACTGQSGRTPESGAPAFAFAYEGGRMYKQDVDGKNLTRISDDAVLGWTRQWGDHAVYSKDGGGLYLVDVAAGKTEQIADGSVSNSVVGEKYAVYALYNKDGTTFSICSYNIDTGETKTVREKWHYGAMALAGDKFLFSEFSFDTGEQYLYCWDLGKNSQVWKEDIDFNSSIDVCGDKALLKTSDGFIQLSVETGETAPSPYEFSDGDYILAQSEDGVWVVNNTSESHGVYYLTQESRDMAFDIDPVSASVTYLGENGGKYLVSLVEYEQYEPLQWYYPVTKMITLEKDKNSYNDITAIGEYGKMFENGDFPILDSSTARKPLTRDIYSFFCLENGIPGAEPLCSTTHGAWTNMADGTIDIALLAAPTQQEKEYLEEKGVEVEMKLYGGDGLVFIGNDACGVTNLTVDQIKAIYRGEITNWSQLGGVDHEIKVLYRDPQSGSQRLFESLVWKGEEMPDFEGLGFSLLSDMSSIVYECTNDPYAIGYSIMTYLKETANHDELLAFSVNGAAPSAENVRDQLYPLNTRGYVVIRSDEPQDSPARRLYNWFGCGVANDMLTRNDITPLSQ